MDEDPEFDIRPIDYDRASHRLRLLDQRKLPEVEVWLELDELEAIAEAIETLAVRGAPAIGCAAALGMAALAQRFPDESQAFVAAAKAAKDRLAATRPTAVNLFHALDHMQAEVTAQVEAGPDVAKYKSALVDAAFAYVEAEYKRCSDLSDFGAPLLPDDGGVLTHCNAGALATAGLGTALGVIRRAWKLGKRFEVLADETRPLLQGARLTAWELMRAQIPVSVLTDSMAGWMMARGRVQAVVVGADRIAANGDTANKIGTYGLAVLAGHHGIPFYVAAPSSTVDFGLESGAGIPIEERAADEVREHGGHLKTPRDIPVENPAFDVTPAELITSIITERGCFAPTELLSIQDLP